MGTLYLYTVYNHPSDYPDHVVVRRHVILEKGISKPEADLFFKADTWQEVRTEMYDRGLVSLGRNHGDDPKILETYI
jgi:hypothetical protein